VRTAFLYKKKAGESSPAFKTDIAGNISLMLAATKPAECTKPKEARAEEEQGAGFRDRGIGVTGDFVAFPIFKTLEASDERPNALTSAGRHR
jgi:hypothetical protein